MIFLPAFRVAGNSCAIKKMERIGVDTLHFCLYKTRLRPTAESGTFLHTAQLCVYSAVLLRDCAMAGLYFTMNSSSDSFKTSIWDLR